MFLLCKLIGGKRLNLKVRGYLIRFHIKFETDANMTMRLEHREDNEDLFK